MLNGFDIDIRVTHDASEDMKSVIFLDVKLQLCDDVMDYCTYRKPLNTYAYVSFDSCHPDQSKLAIIHGECVRLLLTNRSEQNYCSQCAFFRGKLLLRGFPPEAVRKIMSKYPWHAKDHILARRARVKKKIVPLKLTFSNDVDRLGIKNFFRNNEWMLPKAWSQELRCVVSSRSAPNLFRLRYNRLL